MEIRQPHRAATICELGLEAAQGMLLTKAFYWGRNEESRAWAQRYFQRMNKMPNMTQAGICSATTDPFNLSS